MGEIVLKNVTKKFGNNTVIQNLNLTIKDGSFTVLVGPSGCGKKTLMRMIAGIGPQTSGTVSIDGRDISEVAPGDRGVAMVFQNYAIYPTMSVYENIEFGLKNNHIPKDQRKKLVDDACEKVGLQELKDRQPNALSGGQRQRVALARAIVKQPSVFLMDEPLSNLDAKLRVQMRVELIELHHKLKTTFVYVTHDQIEAMSMADTIVLMNDGKIMQMDSPRKLYRDPDNLFAARFIGSPAMNIRKFGKEEYILGFRPEKGIISTQEPQGCYRTSGTVVAKEDLGSEIHYSVRDMYDDVSVIRSEEDDITVGEKVWIGAKPENIYLFGNDQLRIREDDPRYPDLCRQVLALQ